MTRKIILILSLIFSATVLAPSIYGVTVRNQATPSAKASTPSEIKETVSTRSANKVKVSTRVAEVKKEQQELKRTRTHFIGIITELSGTTLKVKHPRRVVTVTTDQNTRYFSLGEGGKKKITLADLKVDDRIAVTGLAQGENTGLAKIIVRLPKVVPEVKRHAISGRVVAIEENVITVKHLKKTNTWKVTVTDQTRIKKKGVEGATLADIKVDDVIAAIGTPVEGEQNSIEAKAIHIIPGKFKGIDKQATSSAKPTATRSATNSSTP